jgi:septal ring factor EnvC (AmiA/AmiB activator)
MSSENDPAEFVDSDFQAHKLAAAAPLAGAAAGRAPSREEVDSRVLEAQQKLAELKRIQGELERERASLEETRRRQMEFQTGRAEMVQHLTRGIGLLEESGFAARRDAEQMAKTLADLREALEKIQAVREEAWTKDNFSVELTRALTTLENARMEWNNARLKFAALSGAPAPAAPEATHPHVAAGPPDLSTMSFGQLCRLGLAFTWPLALIALFALALLAWALLRK